MEKLLRVLLLIFVLLANSCEKKPDSDADEIIFGKIIDSETKEPIKDVSILQLITIYHIYDISLYDTTFVTKTDKDGNYELKRHSQGFLIAHYEDYVDGSLSGGPGTITESNITLVKNSHLIVHIKNVTPYDGSDWFNFGVSINHGWSPDYFSFYNSNNLDTTLFLNIIPNLNHSIWWNATKNDIKTSGNENVFFKSGDTLYRNIFY